MLDWKHLGREYTWNVFDFSGGRFEPTGFATGVYVDKGHVIDGAYEPDSS